MNRGYYLKRAAQIVFWGGVFSLLFAVTWAGEAWDRVIRKGHLR